ncbi:hypothetical protein [Aeoliella sp. SH292]|uniref:hypothetical protein n=1 Tax=Aeoliella sp. SH292 TaxID=3454464 RepID=UPI003F9BAC0D
MSNDAHQFAIEAKRAAFTLPDDLHERARRLKLACAGAAAIERGKRSAGLASSQPAPWPASTWEFLAKHAGQHVQ